MKGILFFDVDGTLIDSAHGKDTPETEVMDAIRKLRDNGYACVVSSGRNMSGLHMLRGIGFDGFVFSDGAGILLENETSEVIAFEHDEIDRIMRDIIYNHHGRVHACHENGSFACQKVYARTLKLVREQYGNRADEILNTYGIQPLEEWTDEKILEVDIFFDSQDARNAWLATMPESLEYIDMGCDHGEITCRGITKAAGCERMCGKFGVNMADCYGFGDSMNDEAMLRACGVGVAMGNSDERLKAHADFVTKDIDDHGLVYAFEQLSLL
ncbi:MAG: HAD-IIB family hydrolase [Bulleidia sp.]